MTEFPNLQQESDEEYLARVARFVGVDQMFPREMGTLNVQKTLLEAKTSLIDLRVRTICEEYSQSTGVEITKNARQLIRLIHTAILADAHPSWSGDLLSAADHYLSTLPTTLAKIAADERIQKITTFDVLHWISRDSDLVTMCVIEK